MVNIYANSLLLNPYPAKQHKNDTVTTPRSEEQPAANLQEHGLEVNKLM